MAKILALTSRVCYPPREGHQLRTWHLLRALAREHEIHLLSFARADDNLEESTPLRDICASFDTFPIPSEHSRLQLVQCAAQGIATKQPFAVAKYTSVQMIARVKELLPNVDLIHVDMLPLMSAIPRLERKIPLVLNAHNVEHLLLRSRVDVESRPLHRAFLNNQVAKLKYYEIQACRRADQVLACSTIDANHLAKLVPDTLVSVIPNGVDTDLNRPDPGVKRIGSRLVFVGQMGWFPNADGVRWFLDQVFPIVLAKRSDTEFLLVGKAQSFQVPQAIAARVRLAGFVKDVRASIQESAVYVVPLRVGSGTRLKVLEAMALGMPIVTTQIGAEGIELAHGTSALFADSAEEFAAAVLQLLDNPDFAHDIAKSARSIATAQYDWQAIGDRLLAIYSTLLRTSEFSERARQR